MKIAALIPARNAGWCIQSSLVALLAAGFDRADVIVVDDGSTDDTAALASAYKVKVITLPRSGGAAKARNIAAAQTNADILFFVDADVVVAPDVLARLFKRFILQPEIDAVFGSYDNAPAHPHRVSKYRNLLHHFVHKSGPQFPKTFWTGCGAVRAAAFERIGGFDPAMRMMEDVDFGMRLSRAGGTIALDRELQGKHLKPWSFLSMIRSDLFDRAIPWSRLMLFGDGLSDDLNLGYRHRLSAMLVVAIVAGLAGALIHPATLIVAALAIVAFVTINAEFVWLIRKNAGRRAAFASIWLHMVHYSCAMAGLAWVAIFEYLPSLIVPRKLTADTTDVE